MERSIDIQALCVNIMHPFQLQQNSSQWMKGRTCRGDAAPYHCDHFQSLNWSYKVTLAPWHNPKNAPGKIPSTNKDCKGSENQKSNIVYCNRCVIFTWLKTDVRPTYGGNARGPATTQTPTNLTILLSQTGTTNLRQMWNCPQIQSMKFMWKHMRNKGISEDKEGKQNEESAEKKLGKESITAHWCM